MTQPLGVTITLLLSLCGLRADPAHAQAVVTRAQYLGVPNAVAVAANGDAFYANPGPSGCVSAPTFSVFGQASAAIPLAPAASRIFVLVMVAAGALHGSTSVAVVAA